MSKGTATQNSGYTGFRWFVLVTLLVATIGNGVTLIALSPNVSDVSATLGVNLGVTSAATMVAYNLACAIMGLFSGKLMDRFGVAAVYTVCFIVNIIATLLYLPIGGSLAGMLVIRIIQGAMMVNIIGSAAKVAAVWFPPKERGIVTGVQAAAIAGGVAVGMMLSPRFTAMFNNWQQGAAMCSIVSVIALILSIIVLVKGQPDIVLEETAFEAVTPEEENKLFRSVWRSPLIYMCVIVGLMFGWGFNVFNDLIPGFAAVDTPVGAGYGAVAAGNMLSFGQVGFMIGALIAGMLLLRLVKGKVRIPLLVCFVVSAIVIWTLNANGVISSHATMQIMVIIAGFFLGCINPFNIGFVSMHFHPAICGRLGSIIMGMTTLGGVIGLAISSTCLSVTGFYHLTIILLGIACIVGGAFSLGVAAPKKKTGAEQ